MAAPYAPGSRLTSSTAGMDTDPETFYDDESRRLSGTIPTQCTINNTARIV